MKHLYPIFCLFIVNILLPSIIYGEETDICASDLLLIKESFIRPENPTATEKVEIKLIFENISPEDKNVIGRLFVDDIAADESSVFVPSGGEGDFLLYFKPQSPKEYKILVKLYEVEVDESHEIPGELWQTDLLVEKEIIRGVVLKIVGGLDLYPPFPDLGDDMEIGIEVENLGNEEARDVSVYFYEDGFSFDRVVVDIHAGDSAYVTTLWTADEGDSYIEVIVDPGGEVTGGGMNIWSGRWITVR